MNVLEKARELVNGDRQADYGDAHENHQRIANLWNGYLIDSRLDAISPSQVAMMMLLVKVARLMQSPNHKDSMVDIAGYAQVYERCAEVDYGTGQDIQQD